MDDDSTNVVLISGGRGFIGRVTGEALRGAGYRVISLDVTGSRESAGEIVGGISDASQMLTLFQQQHVDAIVHLAAILPTAAQRAPLLATPVNVHGSLNLLEMAREFGVRRFVFGSSLSMYGTCSPKKVVTERGIGRRRRIFMALRNCTWSGWGRHTVARTDWNS